MPPPSTPLATPTQESHECSPQPHGTNNGNNNDGHVQLHIVPLEPEHESHAGDVCTAKFHGTYGHVAPAATTSNATAATGASKILFLDGLRGLAALLVVAQHSFFMIKHPVGQPAVDMFFVLSAFLLTMIFEKKARTLLAEKGNAKRWTWLLLDYFVRRFLRVYPLFAVVACVIWVLPLDQRKNYFCFYHPENYDLFQTLTFKFEQRHHVFWSLPLEITYYLIIPPFVLVILALNKFWWVAMLPLSYLVMYSGLFWFRMDHQGLSPHLPTLLCGSMAAIVYVKADSWIKRHKFVFQWQHKLALRVHELVFVGLLFSTVFEGLFSHWWYTNPVPPIKGGGPFISVNIAVIIVSELLLPGAVASVLEWSLLRFAGKISFSMYLLHSFVVFHPWIRGQQPNDDWFFAIWGITFGVSTLSYYAIEYPCQWLAGRIGRAIKQRDMIEKQQAPHALPDMAPTPPRLAAPVA